MVVLPPPLLPTIAAVFPCSTEKLTSESACFDELSYLKETFFNSIFSFTPFSSLVPLSTAFSLSRSRIAKTLSAAAIDCCMAELTLVRAFRGVYIIMRAVRNEKKVPGVVTPFTT